MDPCWIADMICMRELKLFSCRHSPAREMRNSRTLVRSTRWCWDATLHMKNKDIWGWREGGREGGKSIFPLPPDAHTQHTTPWLTLLKWSKMAVRLGADFALSPPFVMKYLRISLCVQYSVQIMWGSCDVATIVIRIVSPRRRLSVTNLSLENNLPTFRPIAPVVIRVKDFCFTLTTNGWSIQSKRRVCNR